MDYQIRKNKFTKARGGTAKFILLSCGACGKNIILYQKDGEGQLVRLYLDKITAPQNLVDIVSNYNTKSEMSGLFCPICGKLLAVPMVYEKEKRLAFRIIHGQIVKKKMTEVANIKILPNGELMIIE